MARPIGVLDMLTPVIRRQDLCVPVADPRQRGIEQIAPTLEDVEFFRVYKNLEGRVTSIGVAGC